MTKEEIREAVVWGIVFEKHYAKHEYEFLRHELPSTATEDDYRQSARRHVVSLVEFAAKQADEVCERLKGLKPTPPPADENEGRETP